MFNDIAPVFNPFYNLEGGINNKSFQIIGAEDVAGRETLIVEPSGPGDGTKTRFWIDIQTGLILRNQLFGNVESQRPEAELLVARIEFDVDFTQDMIDPRLPWRGGYAGDSSGQPDSPFGTYTGDSEALRTNRLPRRPAPEGLDPAKSRLTFQYPEQMAFHLNLGIFVCISRI